MKKLSIDRENVRRRIAERRWRRGLVRRKQVRKGKSRKPAEATNQQIRIVPPKVFSFSKNYDETVGCLKELKRAALSKGSAGKPSQVFLDLEPIESISVAGALVLAAEIDRWRLTIGKKIRPKRAHYWSPKVRSLLYELGFFDLLEVSSPGGGLPTAGSTGELTDSPGSEIRLLPMVSSTKLDQKLLSSLSNISEALHRDPTVYDGLVEAAYNVTKHAYPADHDWEFAPATKGWWATASWNPANGSVKFIVYDQGVGIASTLPRWEGWEKTRELLAMVPGGGYLKDSSRMIKAALEVDRSSLKGGHGKGLWDVVTVARGFEGGKVRILSGTGELLYHHDGTVELREHDQHIGGTLVEWTIPTNGLAE